MKYGNRKTIVYGKVLDSKREARRYAELKLMEDAGEISDLRTQVKFELIPPQYEHYLDGKKPKRKCVERACTYVADFVYLRDGQEVIEDTKGFRTKEYVIKRKLMRYLLHKKIVEI